MALPPFAAVTTADQLSADIKAIDQDSQAQGGTGNAYSITLAPGATLTETADLTAINLSGADTLVINGLTGATLDGGNLYRGFFVYQGDVTIENLTIQNAVAKGGAGSAGGGGGAGLGGGLFVANDPANNGFPAAVTLDNVTFAHDQAIGGAAAINNGGDGGGGGLGGAGGAGNYGSGGGGGIGAGAAGGTGLSPAGSPGIVVGAQAGGSSQSGSNGGVYGGGGSGANDAPPGGEGSPVATGGGGGGIAGASNAGGGNGGYGGFGGGGGGGSSYGGHGGFGGGGGGASYANGGDGGFGGGGGGGLAGGLGGYGGGGGLSRNGSGPATGSGGGGLGAGGDVFVQQGALLTITGGKLSGGSVTGGTSPGNAGNGFGTGIFLQGNVTFGAGSVAGQVTEIDDVITDGPTFGNGAGSVTIEGAGTVRFKGVNEYVGITTIKSGTLDLEAIGRGSGAGFGGISFAPGSNATLELDPSSFTTGMDPGVYSDTVGDFDVGDTIDLRGFTYVPGQTTAEFGGRYLGISNGTSADSIPFSSDGQFSRDSTFITQDDGQRGTDIMLMCFTTGTRIRVAREGEALDLLVQDLAVGDIAVTASGALRPIRWIGQRTIECAAQAIPADAWPVRILPGAFGVGACGNNLPERELRLSPGHPVLVGEGDAECLVPIMCLINGTSIERVPVERVTYWHIELDEHDILYAEGLPAESFLDFGNRPWFGPDGEAHALANPDFVVPGLGARCRPVALDGPLVEAERRRLDALFEMSQAVAGAWPEFDEVFADLQTRLARPRHPAEKRLVAGAMESLTAYDRDAVPAGDQPGLSRLVP